MPERFQSALEAAGVQAARIEWLWWLMFWVCTAVFVLVLGSLWLAVRRGRSANAARPTERMLLVGIASALGVTVAVLFGLLYASAATGRAIGTRPSPEALTIDIVGHQWWWQIEYTHPVPSQRVVTANELHLPVGRPVIFNLRSPDVIHSFWIPNLHGKTDLVPGRLNTTWLQADRTGVFRGQCAEYCGMQHAHMAFPVFVTSEEDFQKWLDGQRAVPPPPSAPEAILGRTIVESGSCALCHTVRGTTAGGRQGPDLTHFATRSTIGAGTAPNSREYLASWVADPQHLKPGNRMPPTGLSAADLQAVVAYLETLR